MDGWMGDERRIGGNRGWYVSVISSACSIAYFELCDGAAYCFDDADAFVAEGHARGDIVSI
jgi:hypothetical protein